MGLLTTAVQAGVAASQGNPLGVVNALAAPVAQLFNPDLLPQLTPAQARQLAQNRAAKLSPADQQLYQSLVALKLQASKNSNLAPNLPVIQAAINVLQDRLYNIVPDANSSDIAILNDYSGGNAAALASFSRTDPMTTTTRTTTVPAGGTAPVKGAAVPSVLAGAVAGAPTAGAVAKAGTPMAPVLAANQPVAAFVANTPVDTPIPSMGLKGTPPSALAGLVNSVLASQSPTMPPARSVLAITPAPSGVYADVIYPSDGAAYPDEPYDPVFELPSNSAASAELGPDTTPRGQQNLMVLVAAVVVLVVVMRGV